VRQALARGDEAGAAQLLRGCAPEARRWEWYYFEQRPWRRERTVLGSFARPVTALAFSPEADYVAAAGGPGGFFAGRVPDEVRVWSVSQRRALLKLDGFSGPVHAVAFSPNGSSLAAAGTNRAGAGEVQAFNVPQRFQLFARPFAGRITAVAYTA